MISGLGFTPDSNQSSEAFEQAATCDIEEEVVLAHRDIAMAEYDAEAARLTEIRERVEYKLSRLRPDRITSSHVNSAQQKLSDILALSEEFGIGITAMLRTYTSMEESFKLQYKSDLDTLEQKVDDIEDLVCQKIHQLQLASQPSVAQPGTVPLVGHQAADVLASGVSQADALLAQAASAKAATLAKGRIKYQALLNHALQTSQDMETDGLYLETASNDRIQKLVLKISKYEQVRDKLKAGVHCCP